MKFKQGKAVRLDKIFTHNNKNNIVSAIGNNYGIVLKNSLEIAKVNKFYIQNKNIL